MNDFLLLWRFGTGLVLFRCVGLWVWTLWFDCDCVMVIWVVSNGRLDLYMSSVWVVWICWFMACGLIKFDVIRFVALVYGLWIGVDLSFLCFDSCFRWFGCVYLFRLLVLEIWRLCEDSRFGCLCVFSAQQNWLVVMFVVLWKNLWNCVFDFVGFTVGNWLLFVIVPPSFIASELRFKTVCLVLGRRKTCSWKSVCRWGCLFLDLDYFGLIRFILTFWTKQTRSNLKK